MLDISRKCGIRFSRILAVRIYKMETQIIRLLDVKAAAKYLSISRSKLYQWMDAGRIKSYRIDSKRLLDIRDLDEFIDNLKRVG